MLSRLFPQILRGKCQNWGGGGRMRPYPPFWIPAPQLRSPDPAGGPWPPENPALLASSPGAGRGGGVFVLFIKSSPAAEAPRDQNNVAPPARAPPPRKCGTSLAFRKRLGNLFLLRVTFLSLSSPRDYKSITNLLRRIGKLRKI